MMVISQPKETENEPPRRPSRLDRRTAWRGRVFATKEEAIAYIVSLASHDIRVVESGDPAALQSAQSGAS
jgi:hypothetical protein